MSNNNDRVRKLQSAASARERLVIYLTDFHAGKAINPRLLDGLEGDEAEKWDRMAILLSGIRLHGRWALQYFWLAAQLLFAEMRLFHALVADCIGTRDALAHERAPKALVEVADSLSVGVLEVWHSVSAIEAAIERSQKAMGVEQDLIDVSTRRMLDKTQEMVVVVREALLSTSAIIQELPGAPDVPPEAQETVSWLANNMETIAGNVRELPEPDDDDIDCVYRLFNTWNHVR